MPSFGQDGPNKRPKTDHPATPPLPQLLPNPAAPAAVQLPAALPPPPSAFVSLSDQDPESLPPSQKKEGADWVVV